MGMFNVEIEISSPDGQRFERVEALVDSGAIYSFMPSSLLDGLGVERQRTMTFVLADGSRIVRDFSYTWARLNGALGMTPVVFSDDDALPLLGAVTLENFGLGIDPVNKRLIAVESRLRL